MKIFKNLAVVLGVSSSICAMDKLPYEVGHKIMHQCIGIEPTIGQISSILPIRTVCTDWKNWFDGAPGIYFQGLTILPIDINSPRLLRALDHKTLSQLTNLSLQFYPDDQHIRQVNDETFKMARIILEKINLKCTQLQKVTLKGPFIIDVLVGEPTIVPNEGPYKTNNPFVEAYPNTTFSFLKPVTQFVMGSCTSNTRLPQMTKHFWCDSMPTLDNLKSIHIMDGSHNGLFILKKLKSLIHIQIDKMDMFKIRRGAAGETTIETVPAGISFIASKNTENVWEITNPEGFLNHPAEKEYFDSTIKNFNEKENDWEIANPESLQNHDTENVYSDNVVKKLNEDEEEKG